MPEGRWPRGVTPRPRSGAVAESVRLRQHSNGGEELPHVPGQGWWLAGRSYPMPNVRAAAERSSPTSKEQWLHGCRRA